ncbi:AreB (Aryl-alcohol dehydrogenase) [Psychrobacter sp. JB385]|nr:AreB (Aryl-alcohol dehydrogenase) [Psychrobacter sp. JB385]
MLLGGKSIQGIVEGDSTTKVFIPQLVELYLQGRFAFDKLVRYYDFKDINQAAKDSEKRITLKPIIRIADHA